jgi:hypothetical protein
MSEGIRLQPLERFFFAGEHRGEGLNIVLKNW